MKRSGGDGRPSEPLGNPGGGSGTASSAALRTFVVTILGVAYRDNGVTLLEDCSVVVDHVMDKLAGHRRSLEELTTAFSAQLPQHMAEQLDSSAYWRYSLDTTIRMLTTFVRAAVGRACQNELDYVIGTVGTDTWDETAWRLQHVCGFWSLPSPMPAPLHLSEWQLKKLYEEQYYKCLEPLCSRLVLHPDLCKPVKLEDYIGKYCRPNKTYDGLEFVEGPSTFGDRQVKPTVIAHVDLTRFGVDPDPESIGKYATIAFSGESGSGKTAIAVRYATGLVTGARAHGAGTPNPLTKEDEPIMWRSPRCRSAA